MNIVEFVHQQEQFFAPAVVDNAVKWEKESQFAIQLFQANDFLAKTAINNPTSAQNAIINVAAIGVSLNPALKHAYLVPRQGKVCLDISYMGLLHLAMESGSILWGQAVIVHKNDEFKLTGLGSLPIHNYSPFGDRGEIVGVYCTVKTAHGDFLTECMSIDEVYSIRNRSESYKRNSGPWVSDAGEMIKKTVVKRANKYWPKVSRLSAAIEYLNTQAGEGIETEPVMRHYSESEVKQMQAEQDAQLASEVQSFIDMMEMSESESQLKSAFGSAFKMTRQNKQMNQQVQEIYAKNKQRLGIN